MGVLRWKPAEIRQASCEDIALSVSGYIQNYNWQLYAEGMNLSRLAYAMSMALSGEKLDLAEIFDYSIKKPIEPADDATIEQMAGHFPSQLK